MTPLNDNARQTAQHLGTLAAELSTQRSKTKPLPISNRLSAYLSRLQPRSPASEHSRHKLLANEFILGA